MEGQPLPYRAEYAKSGRAACKGCKDPIPKDSLRLAVMVQSPFFDGMQPNWHHFSCFFGRCRPKNTGEIAHFESLRWDDQEKLKNKIDSLVGSPAPAPSKGKTTKSKKRNNAESSRDPNLADYTVEYAKSKRSKCKVCDEFINKDEIRISKKDFESETAMRYGPTERWHHVDCFLKVREELSFFGAATVLPGFKTLAPEDQKMLKSKILSIANNDTADGPSPPKKAKENDMEKEELKKQNDKMFKFRDQLELLTKPELVTLLEYNKQEIPEGVPRMLDRLCDGMAFGALKKCEKCNKGQLTFVSGTGYVCSGNISEWSKCQATYEKPARVPFKVPKELKDDYSFLNKYKGKVVERLFRSSCKRPTTSNAIVKNESILSRLKFLIHKTGEGKTGDDVKKKVEQLGGSIVKNFDENVIAVISTKAEVNKSKLSKTLKSAKDSKVQVIPDDFFDEITASTSANDFITKLNDKKISDWDSDSSLKVKELMETKKKSPEPTKSVNPKKSEMFKATETVKKITLKDGLAVDPDSKLEKVAHVYREGDDIYSVVLSLTDVQSGRNSYYKLQILESDKKNKYWVFRAWGRIGTTIGGNKCEQYDTLYDCIELFEELFEEKTGNSWEMRNHFVKVAGKMMMLEIQYNDDTKDKKPSKSKSKPESKLLSKPVQELITLIFDIEAMKKTMLEFELDLNKMPLGKLSQKQIHKAFGILSELQKTIISSNSDKQTIIDRTNRFYTLVPHDCGVNVPPILDNEELIKQKIDMLNSLMDIEIAYNLLQECENSENPIDEHYKKLNAKITDLDSSEEEYKTIETFVRNTHAKTHMSYTLEIQNVFKIERKGEAERYKKYKKLPNRKLLWHGSRVTNFAGILSQGLRIAPPEAPVTGYMFGKGIYFADMVSKSANYCSTSRKNPIGLLLLCEVALGEMHELTEANYIEKLPGGKDSVKGMGKTHPDPSETVTTKTGVEIPLGKGVDSNVKKSSLLYNEYIVYNVEQVKIQYLLRVKFNYKH